MSPEQLKKLHTLSQLFKEGRAGTEQIKQLSELLASINHHFDPESEQPDQDMNHLNNGVR